MSARPKNQNKTKMVYCRHESRVDDCKGKRRDIERKWTWRVVFEVGPSSFPQFVIESTTSTLIGYGFSLYVCVCVCVGQLVFGRFGTLGAPLLPQEGLVSTTECEVLYDHWSNGSQSGSTQCVCSHTNTRPCHRFMASLSHQERTVKRHNLLSIANQEI